MDNIFCHSCFFWTGNRSSGIADLTKEPGECRRFPAQVGGIIQQQGVAGPTIGAVTFFPTVTGGQWCGEHKLAIMGQVLQ